MEYIPDASKLTNLEQIEAKGLNRKAVGKSVVEVFASQIFDMGFVQADGHPRYVNFPLKLQKIYSGFGFA